MKYKLKPERPGVLLVSIFYAVVGVALAFILILDSFRLFHVGVLAVLNLMLSYGLFKMKKWSVKLLATLFLPQVVFGVITLYHSILKWTFPSTWEILVFNLLLILYVILSLISLVYVGVKRKNFT